jgi:8-oxo-dGTP pyrophosphatase MutT (NUDIX family)
MTDDKTIPRLAATIVVVREATPEGLEVLLLRRADKGDHNSGAWVFPGGLLDTADRACHAFCDGLDDARASTLLGVPEGGLDHVIAAIRESFEEAGVLFATGPDGQPAELHGDAGHALAAMRSPLGRGDLTLADLCRDFGLRLSASALFYIGHWVTPVGRAKRFDTRFFLAVLPPGQESRHDEIETVEQVWLRPAEALSPENSRRLMTPTRAMIEQVGRFDSVEALLAWARSPREVPRVLPLLPVEPPR